MPTVQPLMFGQKKSLGHGHDYASDTAFCFSALIQKITRPITYPTFIKHKRQQEYCCISLLQVDGLSLHPQSSAQLHSFTSYLSRSEAHGDQSEHEYVILCWPTYHYVGEKSISSLTMTQ